jgi:hypothetical protein
VDTHAALFDALVVYAYLPVTRASLGGAIDGVALPRRATLAGRALAQAVDAVGPRGAILGDLADAAGGVTFVLDAYLANPGAVSGLTTTGVADPVGAGLVHRAFHAQASHLHAQIVVTYETLGTVTCRAVSQATKAVD